VRAFGGGFGVLRDRRYRRFLFGAISYGVALWSFQTVMVLATLERTSSAAAISLLTICITLPTLIFSLVAGTLADRRDPRNVMLVAQCCAVAFVGLALLAAALDAISLPVSAGLIFIVGCFDAFSNVPAMVYVGRLVEPRLMASALGLSGLQVGGGRIGGGIVAGVAFQLGGPVAGLAISMAALGLSALVVSTLPRLSRADATRAAGRFGVDDLRVAAAWVRGSPPAIAIIVLGLAAATLVYSYFALLPIFARDLIGGGSVTLGALTSSGGVGVVIGALVIDATGRRFGRGRVVLGGLALASVAFAALGASRILPLSMALMVLLTGSLGMYRVTCQLLLQALAPARIRGRVLATYELTFWGIFTVGTLAAGALADAYGSGAVALAFGAATIGCVGVVLLGYRAFARLDVDNEGRAALAGRILSDRTPPPQAGRDPANRTDPVAGLPHAVDPPVDLAVGDAGAGRG
jgi:MFS family permease